MYAIETIPGSTEAIRGRLFQDPDPPSPAEWSNLGHIAYMKHSRYTLGDERVSEDRMDEIRDGIADGTLIGLPVYAYIHSGVTLSTKPFGCRFDSGQCGFAYCTPEDVIAEYGADAPEHRASALATLGNEVAAWAQYLAGEVYGYQIERLEDDEWKHVDSCWGHYGIDRAREEAASALAHAKGE